MSELPSILVTDGWETDQNDKCTEIVIPSSVKTLQAPTKVTFLGKTLNAIPSTAAALQELDCPNVVSLPNNILCNCSALTSVSMPALQSIGTTGQFGKCTSLTSVYLPSLTSISSTTNNSSGIFQQCTSLTSISLPELTSITSNTGNNGSFDGGLFFNCTSLSSVSFPKLQSITQVTGGSGGVFCNCTSLETLELPELSTISCGSGSLIRGSTTLRTINFPKIQTITSGNSANHGAFCKNTSITSVTLGSVGHPVSSIGANTFGNCTQSGLTITIYTSGGASLSGEKWGATNATIVYRSA